MVGDRHHHVGAGRNCGMATAGVTWRVGGRQELARAGATVIVDTAAELDALLLSFR